MRIPSPQCGVCGRHLSLRGTLRQWRRSETSYPFRMQDGSRQEQPVRWLCYGCERRAERLRIALIGAPEDAESDF
ncbi:MAG: hypothetical protein ACK47B_25550 [Armatimonadota bacterium]